MMYVDDLLHDLSDISDCFKMSKDFPTGKSERGNLWFDEGVKSLSDLIDSLERTEQEKPPDNLGIKIRLESLITEREGMVSENMQREHLGQSPAFVGEQFVDLIKRLENLIRCSE